MNGAREVISLLRDDKILGEVFSIIEQLDDKRFANDSQLAKYIEERTGKKNRAVYWQILAIQCLIQRELLLTQKGSPKVGSYLNGFLRRHLTQLTSELIVNINSKIEKLRDV